MHAKYSHSQFVVIGGGTGSFAVLSGLKQYTHHITALVSMADDGGSTGTLRDELGVLPPGDIRQCLVALSDPSTSNTLRNLFNFRFEEGSLRGHSFGNLFLSAVEKMTNNFDEAVELAGELLHITGRVMPITLDNVRLVLQWDKNHKVVGEGAIDILDFALQQGAEGTKPQLSLQPQAFANPHAIEAILQAQTIVIAPGDLYTSLGPLLVVNGVAEALRQTSAKIIYVCNLVTKQHQTQGFSVADHVSEIERFIGHPVVDVVLYNTAQPKTTASRMYDAAGEHLVRMNRAQHKNQHYQLIGGNFLADDIAVSTSGDLLAKHRSLIRHDGLALARALLHIATDHK